MTHLKTFLVQGRVTQNLRVRDSAVEAKRRSSVQRKGRQVDKLHNITLVDFKLGTKWVQVGLGKGIGMGLGMRLG